MTYSLNANTLPNNKKMSDMKRPDPLTPGTYPGRLVQVFTLGIQPQRPYKGEDKEPQLELYTTYEMSDEFMKDDDGNDIADKPRWLSETLPFFSLKADRAKSTKRYLSLDPNQEAGGDWGELVGNPVMITVINEASRKPGVDIVYDNIASTSTMRPKEAAKLPELVNPSKVFDFYSPDKAVWDKIPEWIQTKMRNAVDYNGSALQAMLGEKPKMAAPVTKQAINNEDETPSAKDDLEDGISW